MVVHNGDQQKVCKDLAGKKNNTKTCVYARKHAHARVDARTHTYIQYILHVVKVLTQKNSQTIMYLAWS